MVPTKTGQLLLRGKLGKYLSWDFKRSQPNYVHYVRSSATLLPIAAPEGALQWAGRHGSLVIKLGSKLLSSVFFACNRYNSPHRNDKDDI